MEQLLKKRPNWICGKKKRLFPDDDIPITKKKRSYDADPSPDDVEPSPDDVEPSPDDVEPSPDTSNVSPDNVNNLNDISFKLFEELVRYEKIDPSKNQVNLSDGQKCDPSKTYWTPNQFTKTVKVSLKTIALIIKEKLGESICSVEFYGRPNLNDTTSVNDIVNLNRVINSSENNLTSSDSISGIDEIINLMYDGIPNYKKFDWTKNLLKKGIELIENSAVSETLKKNMFKKLINRSLMGEYRVLNGYFVHDQNDDVESLGLFNFVEAALTQSQKFTKMRIDLRKIRALTFQNTRYEVVDINYF
jgi:hypothetical protein